VTLRAKGTYAVRPRNQAVKDALQRTGPREAVRQSLATLVLIEIEVTGAPGRPNLSEWHQNGSDQVPWDEVYTTLDCSTVIGTMHNAPAGGDFVMSFFLHFFDPSKPLETPWGAVRLSPVEQARPPHLRDRMYRDPGS
jgi:hypothetical protein